MGHGASSGPQGLYTAYMQPIYSLYTSYIQPIYSLYTAHICMYVRGRGDASRCRRRLSLSHMCLVAFRTIYIYGKRFAYCVRLIACRVSRVASPKGPPSYTHHTSTHHLLLHTTAHEHDTRQDLQLACWLGCPAPLAAFQSSLFSWYCRALLKTRALFRTYIHTYIHTYTHTHIYIYVHAHTYIYIYVCRCMYMYITRTQEAQ